jgi:hypothetical protein
MGTTASIEINAQRDPTRVQSSEQYGAGEGGAQDTSSESGGGPARPKSGSDSGESLDDVRDQFQGGEG